MKLRCDRECLQVGDYVDTLLLPSSGLKNATVRWVPGPGEITGPPAGCNPMWLKIVVQLSRPPAHEMLL